MAKASERYLRVYIHVRKDECRAMQEFLGKPNRNFSGQLYSLIQSNRAVFEKILSRHGLKNMPHGAGFEVFIVNLSYLEKYADECKLIAQHKKHHIMRDALRQFALYGTFSPDQVLVKEQSRNPWNKTGRKRKDKSIGEVEVATTGAVNTALLACLKGKKDPRELFGKEHHADLHFAMSSEISCFVVGSRVSLADAEYDWSLVPPSEYPEVIRNSSSFIDLKTLLRQVNPALVDK